MMNSTPYPREIKAFIVITVAIISTCLMYLAVILKYSLVNGQSGAAYQALTQACTKVGYSVETLGTVERVKPISEIRNEGYWSQYPAYGKNLSLDTEGKNQILAENKLLCGKKTNTGGTYDWMDANGYLYTGTRQNYQSLARQIYQHTAATDLYYGNVSGQETAYVKRFTFAPRRYSSYYEVTGLYAPAGEVIKIEISNTDMQATGGIIVHIGQALYNGQANNIWPARNFNRLPIILNTMWITKDTAVYQADKDSWVGYVGSFVGGPIYIRDEKVNYTVTISGGVNYPHLIWGVTTAADYEILTQSSAPYFDLEIWDSGVLHSGPYSCVKNYSYNDLCQAAELWEKITLVSNRVVNQGVVFLYDPFVAAGAAVAFPGRRSVNCPTGWMANALNYQGFVTSGSWGNLHEYHHNFQNFGVGSTDEVTNNALNLVTYSLFTKISAARQISNYGAAGLSGWNTYTSAPWALNRVNTNAITGTNGLAVYATLLHNLGQDAFIQTTGKRNKNYWQQWTDVTHQDFSYYVDLISAYGGAMELPANDYPLFVPIACTYQTGRSYQYDQTKRYINTMQPFVIPYGEAYLVDLNPYTVNNAGQYVSGSIVIGNNFQYQIKNINTKGLQGRWQALGDNRYTFTPNQQLRSGKVYVTLEITTADGSHTYQGKTLQDVDLVLEFQQTHETNKAILERTVYTFSEDQSNQDARTLYNSNYAGYVQKTTENNINPVQNSNTDVWLYPQQAQYQDNPDQAKFVVDNHQVFEIKGKLYFPESSKYRIYLRGRRNCALYLSNNNRDYHLGAYIDASINTTSANFLTDERTYIDVEMTAGSWLYFKEVLVTTQYSTVSFVGLGLTQWTVPTYTAIEKYFDRDNQEVDSPNAATYDHSQTYYYNVKGEAVSETEASQPTPIAPTKANYATAYRQSYEFPQTFTSDYFYRPNYTLTINNETFQHVAPATYFQYQGRWQLTHRTSNFGRVSVGQHGAELVYCGPIKQLAILTDKKQTSTLRVYIDGKLLPSLTTEQLNNVAELAYLSPVLNDKTHQIIIRCIGQGSIDSIAIRK